MAKVDFITLSNIIFKDKSKFKYVTPDEKEDNFFILNRKFAFKYLKQAQFFNNKNIDKSSAVDIWFNFFYKITNGTPQWWWKTKSNSKNVNKIKSIFSNTDIKLVKEFYSMTDNDVKFLSSYFQEDLKKDISRIKKFDNGNK
jgi:hypothetical protein